MGNCRKTPMTKEEHIKFAEDLRKCQEILEPWLQVLHESTPMRSRQCNAMHEVLRVVSSKMGIYQELAWFKLDQGKSPYHGHNGAGWG